MTRWHPTSGIGFFDYWSMGWPRLLSHIRMVPLAKSVNGLTPNNIQ